jgi:hypothetical protein
MMIMSIAQTLEHNQTPATDALAQSASALEH